MYNNGENRELNFESNFGVGSIGRGSRAMHHRSIIHKTVIPTVVKKDSSKLNSYRTIKNVALEKHELKPDEIQTIVLDSKIFLDGFKYFYIKDMEDKIWKLKADKILSHIKEIKKSKTFH